MAVSGLWQQRAARDYTGATKWGNGIDPIHAVRDNGRGRVVGARETLLPLGEPSDVVDEGLTAREIDWLAEDYNDREEIPGEHFRYQDEQPRWDETTPQFRDSSTSPAMGETLPWGVYNDSDPSDVWPLPGPTGGQSRDLDVSHGEDQEQQHAIAVPTPPVSGGWLSKARGALAVTEGAQEPGQDGYQLTINTAQYQGQGVQSRVNERAVQRGTDAARTPIQARTAGMAEKSYARSWGMGGGSGTPDMQPYQLTAGMKRPWLTRVAGVPPTEDHFMNTMEGRSPIQRYTTPDPWQGDPETGPGDSTAGDWGY